MKATTSIILLCTQLYLLPLFGFEEGDCSLHKKETKALHRNFGEHAVSDILQIPPDEGLPAQYINPGDCIYSIAEAGETQGYLISTRAKGRYDYFDYCIIYSDDLTIMEVLITVYRSDHGAAVCQKGWLSQFSGYNGGVLKLGSDIDAVSGGTVSASSMVDDIQRCQLLMSAILPK